MTNPSTVIAKCCGYFSRILARKRGTSSGSSAFGSSSEYGACKDSSNGFTPFIGFLVHSSS